MCSTISANMVEDNKIPDGAFVAAMKKYEPTSLNDPTKFKRFKRRFYAWTRSSLEKLGPCFKTGRLNLTNQSTTEEVVQNPLRGADRPHFPYQNEER